MNNVQNAATVTVEEIQAAHLEGVRSQTVEFVLPHELFGLNEPLAGVKPLPVPVEAHPLTPDRKSVV